MVPWAALASWPDPSAIASLSLRFPARLALCLYSSEHSRVAVRDWGSGTLWQYKGYIRITRNNTVGTEHTLLAGAGVLGRVRSRPRFSVCSRGTWLAERRVSWGKWLMGWAWRGRSLQRGEGGSWHMFSAPGEPSLAGLALECKLGPGAGAAQGKRPSFRRSSQTPMGGEENEAG